MKKRTAVVLLTLFCINIGIISNVSAAELSEYEKNIAASVFKTDADIEIYSERSQIRSKPSSSSERTYTWYITTADKNIGYIEAENSFPSEPSRFHFDYIALDRACFKDNYDKLKYIKFGDLNATVLTQAFANCPELSAVRFGQKTVASDCGDFSIKGHPFYIGMPGGPVFSNFPYRNLYSNYDPAYSAPNETVFVYKAFLNCPKLNLVVIDGAETNFDMNAFYNCGEDLVIYCPAGSKAEECAKRDGIATVTIPEMSETEKKIFDEQAYYPYAEELHDIADPEDEEILYAHWLAKGLPNGINASKYFNAQKYLENNKDVKYAFGNDYVKAYNHYITYGIDENRNAGGEPLYPAKFIYGDADADGILTAADASLVLQKVLTPDLITLPIEEKSAEYEKYLDTDGDGILTASDALEIQQKSLNEDYIMLCER